MGEKVICKETLVGRNDIELYTKGQAYEVKYMTKEVIVRDNTKCLRPFYDTKMFNKHFKEDDSIEQGTGTE